MNKQLDLCPFLISRNERLDYGVIVAPKFLVDNQLLSALIQSTQNERETQSGTVVHHQVQYEEDNRKDFTLFFRVDVATKQDIGEDSSDKLKDTSYTPVKLIQGVVCKGLISDFEAKITSEYLEKIHQYLMVEYQKFWYNQTSSVFSSQPLSNQDTSSEFIKVRSISKTIVKSPVQKSTTDKALEEEQGKLLNSLKIVIPIAALFMSVLLRIIASRK